MHHSAGILTSCPSAAAFAIALGPTKPWMIVIAKETLGFRRQGFSPCLWLLVPTFSLPNAPVPLAGEPSQHLKCSPTACPARTRNKPVTSVCRRTINKLIMLKSASRLHYLMKDSASGLCLAPLNFKRTISWQVSCYALFKGWLLLSQPPCCLRDLTTFAT